MARTPNARPSAPRVTTGTRSAPGPIETRTASAKAPTICWDFAGAVAAYHVATVDRHAAPRVVDSRLATTNPGATGMADVPAHASNGVMENAASSTSESPTLHATMERIRIVEPARCRDRQLASRGLRPKEVATGQGIDPEFGVLGKRLLGACRGKASLPSWLRCRRMRRQRGGSTGTGGYDLLRA